MLFRAEMPVSNSGRKVEAQWETTENLPPWMMQDALVNVRNMIQAHSRIKFIQNQ